MFGDNPVALIDLPIERRASDVELPRDASVARILLRLYGRPVGVAYAPVRDGVLRAQHAVNAATQALQGPVGMTTLKLLARWTLEARGRARCDIPSLLSAGPAEAARTTLASLTAVVCTRNRHASLPTTLASLQPLLADGAEVLVIDNASADPSATRSVVERFPGVCLQREPAVGLDRARNRALQAASREIVVFIDDDALADPHWAHAITRLFAANPDLSVATGLVEPASLETKAARWFEAYGGFGRGFERRWLACPEGPSESIAFTAGNTGAWGTGTNLAFRRDHALALGGFDPCLDVGTPTRGGGDLEMMFRVLKAGGLLGYEPNAIVRHQHRPTYTELRSQIESWGSGMVAYLTRTVAAHPEEAPAVVALRVWLYSMWFARRLAISWFRAPFPPTLILHELAGTFRGARRYTQAAMHEPPPLRTPALHPNGLRRRVAEHVVDLGAVDYPLSVVDASTLLLTLRVGRRLLGQLEMPVVGGWIGVDRLRDAVVNKSTEAVLAMPHDRALRAVVDWYLEHQA